MMATRRPTASAALLILSMVSLWLLKSPWEKFRRATFMPANIICSRICGESEAGPMVQTSLVLLGGKAMFYLLILNLEVGMRKSEVRFIVFFI
jgi:hypothetical protein